MGNLNKEGIMIRRNAELDIDYSHGSGHKFPHRHYWKKPGKVRD